MIINEQLENDTIVINLNGLTAPIPSGFNDHHVQQNSDSWQILREGKITDRLPTQLGFGGKAKFTETWEDFKTSGKEPDISNILSIKIIIVIFTKQMKKKNVTFAKLKLKNHKLQSENEVVKRILSEKERHKAWQNI